MQSVWDWIIAIYLFLGGLGAGAFLVAAYFELSGKRARVDSCPACLVGATLPGPLVGIGALLLILDLGAGMREPLRIFYMFTHFSSVMTWGIWILCGFIPLALIYGVLELLDTYGKVGQDPAKGSRLRTAKRVIAAVGSLFAVGTALYTGVLLSAVGPALPFWSISLGLPILPILFLVSAVSTGVALTLLLSEALAGGDRQTETGRLSLVHLALIALEVILIALLLAVALGQGGAAKAAAEALTTGSHSLLFWLLFVLPGLAVPLIALGVAKIGVHSRAIALVEGVCILAAGLVLRYLVLISGFTVPL